MENSMRRNDDNTIKPAMTKKPIEKAIEVIQKNMVRCPLEGKA